MNYKIFILFLTILLVGSVSAAWTVGLDVGLTRYYNFNETSGDLIDNYRGLYNGTLTGATQGVSGKIETAYDFSEDYVTIPNTELPVGTNNFTISMWAYQDTLIGWQILIANSNGWSVANPSGSSLILYYDGVDYLEGSVGFAIDTWYHIVWVRNGTNTKVYVNNVIKIDGTISNSISAGTTWLGKSSAGQYWDGRIDEMAFWNRSLTVSEVSDLWNGGAGTTLLKYLTTPVISVTLNAPTNNSQFGSNTITFNATHSITNANLTNTTLIVWSNGIEIGRNYTVIAGTTNYTNLTFSNLSIGTNLWNYYTCGINATATICNWSSSNYTLNRVSYTSLSTTFNHFVYETETQSFTWNFTTDASSVTNPRLIYNGTLYSTGTIINSTPTNYYINMTIDIPLVRNNKSFNFRADFDGSTQNSETLWQYTNNTNLTRCIPTINNPYINFTFNDEATDLEMNASIDSASWTYWLGSGTVNKTYSYSNSSSSQSYAFCLSPADKTLNTNLVLKYSNTSYPIRTYSSYNKALTNTTTNKLLYLLSSTTGQYVSFQIIDNTGTVIQGVFVNVTRSIGGVTVGIEQGLTGSDGTITFWLNPSFPHTIIVSKSGFDTYTTSITPSQTTYTISLGTSILIQITDYLRGIIYKIRPRLGTVLLPNTIYDFNLTLSSTYWTLSSFGFNLINNGTIVGSNSSTSNGGIVTLSLNTSNYTHIKMYYYWITNGTTTNATSGGWLIYNYEDGGNWSLSALFGDIKTYSNQEIFGLDTDALNLIIFILIFVSVGIMSYKFGFSSPAVISGMVFALVFLFDVGLGMINLDIGIPHFPTIIIGIIMIGFIIKEAT